MLWITLLLTFLVLVGVILALAWSNGPQRRLTRSNVVSLFNLVLSGKATEHDWRLFSAISLSHDPLLNDIRNRALDIEERDNLAATKPGFLFSNVGLDEINILKAELQALDK